MSLGRWSNRQAKAPAAKPDMFYPKDPQNRENQLPQVVLRPPRECYIK